MKPEPLRDKVYYGSITQERKKNEWFHKYQVKSAVEWLKEEINIKLKTDGFLMKSHGIPIMKKDTYIHRLINEAFADVIEK
jgi:hypothetical protein